MTFYEAQRIPLRLILTSLMRIRIEGAQKMPRDGGVVVVSNHLTLFDPLVLGIAFNRPLHFMAKEELFRSRPLAWWLTKSGTFQIRRGEADRVAIKHAEGLLRQGEVVMVFPEGHRSVSAQLQAARAGAVLLASRANCPILPVAITGTEYFRSGTDRTFPRRLTSRPIVRIRVGKLLTLPQNARGKQRNEIADEIMSEVVSLLPTSYHGVYGGGEREI